MQLIKMTVTMKEKTKFKSTRMRGLRGGTKESTGSGQTQRVVQSLIPHHLKKMVMSELNLSKETIMEELQEVITITYEPKETNSEIVETKTCRARL